MMIEQGRDDSMQKTVEAIAQLATATASDRSTVATLTTTNAKLANQLKAAHALIAQLKNEIATLKHKCNMQHEEERTSRCCNEDRHRGWSTMGQRITRRGS
jgi:predicted RNase H-like nuclease (RuvC/YqgF family)